jgi:hypothetical protein
VPNPVGHLGWIPELRAAQLLDVPRTTLRAWVDSGLILLPTDGAYRFRHVIEALLAWAVREHLSSKVAVNVLMKLRAGSALDDAIAYATAHPTSDRFDVVIDLGNGKVCFCWDDASLIAAVADETMARKVVVQPLAARLAHAIDGFENLAEHTPVPAARRPGRPASATASTNVTPLRRRS